MAWLSVNGSTNGTTFHFWNIYVKQAGTWRRVGSSSGDPNVRTMWVKQAGVWLDWPNGNTTGPTAVQVKVED